ncbi:MAG: histidine kinase dimerization/phosphoacceptor domain -containing protein [Balneolales bacterium]
MCIVEGSDHIYRFVNKAYYKILGAENVLNKPAKEVNPHYVKKGLVDRLNEAFSSGREYWSKEVPHIYTRNNQTVKRYKTYHFQPLADDDGHISGIFIQIDDVTNEVELRKYNEVLLQELDHRVRNNIAIILSLLQLQANEIKDQNQLAPFLEAQKRIRVFSKVHELIFSQDDLKNIPILKLLKRLAHQELNLFNPDHSAVSIDVAEFYLNINQAILLGLICNEIVSFASRRLSNGRKRTVSISSDLSQYPEVRLMITINNTGELYPNDRLLWDDNQFEGKLINILGSQLKAKLTACESDDCSTLSLTFIKADIAGSAAGYFVDDEPNVGELYKTLA